MKFFLYIIFSLNLLCNLDPLPKITNSNQNTIEVFNESTNPDDYFKSAGLKDEIDDINNHYRNPSRLLIIDRNTKLVNFYKENDRDKKELNYKKSKEILEKDINELNEIIKKIEKNDQTHLYKNDKGDFIDTSLQCRIEIYPKYGRENPYIIINQKRKRIYEIEKWFSENKDFFDRRKVIEEDNEIFKKLAIRIDKSNILNLKSEFDKGGYEERFFNLLEKISNLSSSLDKEFEKNEKFNISYLDEKEIEGTLYIKVKLNIPLNEDNEKKKQEELYNINSKLAELSSKINLQCKDMIFSIERGQTLYEVNKDENKNYEKKNNNENKTYISLLPHKINLHTEEGTWFNNARRYFKFEFGFISLCLENNEIFLDFKEHYYNYRNTYFKFKIGHLETRIHLPNINDYLNSNVTLMKNGHILKKNFNILKNFRISSNNKIIKFPTFFKYNLSLNKYFDEGKIRKDGHRTSFYLFNEYEDWRGLFYVYYDYRFKSTLSNFYKITQKTLDEFKIIKLPSILLLKKDGNSIYSEDANEINKKMLFNNSNNIYLCDEKGKELNKNIVFRNFFDLKAYVDNNKAYLKEILIPSVLVERLGGSEQQIVDISFLKDSNKDHEEIFDLGDGAKNILKFRIKDFDFKETSSGYITVLNVLFWLLEPSKFEEIKRDPSNEKIEEEINKYTSNKLQEKRIKDRVNTTIENYIQSEIIKYRGNDFISNEESSNKVFNKFDGDYEKGIMINLTPMLENKVSKFKININKDSVTYQKLEKLRKEASEYKENRANFRKILDSSLQMSGKEISVRKNFNSSFVVYELILPIDFKDFYKLDLKTSKIGQDKINIKDLLVHIRTNFEILSEDERTIKKIEESEKTRIIKCCRNNLYELIYDLELDIQGLTNVVPVRLVLKPLINYYPLISDKEGFGSEEPKIDINEGKIFFTFHVKRGFNMKNKNIFKLNSEENILSDPIEVTSKLIIKDRRDKSRLDSSLKGEKLKLYKDIKRYETKEEGYIYLLEPEIEVNNDVINIEFLNLNENEKLNFKKVNNKLEANLNHNINDDKLYLKISAKYNPEFEKYFDKINSIRLIKFEVGEICNKNNNPFYDEGNRYNLFSENIKSQIENVKEYISNGFYLPISRQLRYDYENKSILVLEIDRMKKILEYFREFFYEEDLKDVRLKLILNLHIETDKGNIIEDEQKNIYVKFVQKVKEENNLREVFKKYQEAKEKELENLEINDNFSHINVNVTTFFKEGRNADILMKNPNFDNKLYKNSFYYSYSEYEAISNCSSEFIKEKPEDINKYPIIEVPLNANRDENKIRIAFLAVSDLGNKIGEREEIDKYINRDKVLIYVTTPDGNILINENEVRNLVNTINNQGVIEIPLSHFKDLDLNKCSIKIVILPTIRFRGNLKNIKKENQNFKGNRGLAEGNFQTYDFKDEFEDYFAKFKKQKEFIFKLSDGANIELQPSTLNYDVFSEAEINITPETKDIRFLGKTELSIPFEGYKSTDNLSGVKAYIALGLDLDNLFIDNISELRSSLEENLNGRINYVQAELDSISNEKTLFKLGKTSSQNTNVKIIGAIAFRNGFKVVLKDVNKLKFKNNALETLRLSEAVYLPKKKSLKLVINTQNLPLKLNLDSEERIFEIEDGRISNKTKIIETIFQNKNENLRKLILNTGTDSKNYKISFVSLPKNLELNAHYFLRKNFSTPSRKEIFFKNYLEGEMANYSEGTHFTWRHFLVGAILETKNDKNFITEKSKALLNIEVDKINISLKGELNNNLKDNFKLEKSESNGKTLDLLFEGEDIFTEVDEEKNSFKIESPKDLYEIDINRDKSILSYEKNSFNFSKDNSQDTPKEPSFFKHILENTPDEKVIEYFSKKDDIYKPQISGKVFKITKIKGINKNKVTDEIVGDIGEEKLKFYNGSTNLLLKTEKYVYPFDGEFIEDYLPFKNSNATSLKTIEDLGKEDYIFYLKTLLLASSESLLIQIFQAGIQKFDEEIKSIGSQLKNERETYINGRLNQIESRIKDIEYRRGWWKTFFSIMKFSLNAGMSLVSGPAGLIVGNIFSNSISAIEMMGTGNASFGLDLKGYSLGLDLNRNAQGFEVAGGSFSYGNYSSSYNKYSGFSAAANYSSNGLNAGLSTSGDMNLSYDFAVNNSDKVKGKTYNPFSNVNLGAKVNVFADKKTFAITVDASKNSVGVRTEMGLLFDPIKGPSLLGEAGLKYTHDSQEAGKVLKGDVSLRAEIGKDGDKSDRNFSINAKGSITSTKGMWSAKNLGASLSANYNYDKQLIYSTAGLTYNGVSILDLKATATWNESNEIKKLAGFESEITSPAYFERIFKLAGKELVLQIEGIKRQNLAAEASNRIAKKLEENKEKYKNKSEKEKGELIFNLMKDDPNYELIGRKMYIDREEINPSLPHLGNTISQAFESNDKLMKVYKEIYEKEIKERDKEIEEKINPYKEGKGLINGKLILNVKSFNQDDILRVVNENMNKAFIKGSIEVEGGRKIDISISSPVHAWEAAFPAALVLIDKEKSEYRNASYAIPDKNGKYIKKMELDAEALKSVRTLDDIYFKSKKDGAGNDIVIAVVQENNSEIISLSNKKENKIVSGNVIVNKAKIYIQCEDKKFDSGDQRFVASVELDKKSNNNEFKINLSAAIADNFYDKLKDKDIAGMDQNKFNEKLKKISSEVRQKFEEIKNEVVNQLKNCADEYEKNWNRAKDNEKFRRQIGGYTEQINKMFEKDANNVLDALHTAIKSTGNRGEILKNLKENIANNSNFFYKAEDGSLKPTGIAQTMILNLEDDVTNLRKVSMKSIEEKLRPEEIKKLNKMVNDKNLTGKEYIEFFENIFVSSLSEEQKKKVVYEVLSKSKDKTNNISGIQDPTFYRWMKSNESKLFSKVGEYDILQDDNIRSLRNSLKDYAADYNLERNKKEFDRGFELAEQGKLLKYGNAQLSDKEVNRIYARMDKVSIKEENGELIFKGIAENISKELQEKIKETKKQRGSLNKEEIFQVVKEYVKDNPIAMVRTGINSLVEPNIGAYAVLGKLKDLIFDRKGKDTFHSKHNIENREIVISKSHIGAKTEKPKTISYYSLGSKGQLKSFSDKKELDLIINLVKPEPESYTNDFIVRKEYNYYFNVGGNKIIYSYNPKKKYNDEETEYVPKSSINVKAIIDQTTWKFKGDIKR